MLSHPTLLRLESEGPRGGTMGLGGVGAPCGRFGSFGWPEFAYRIGVGPHNPILDDTQAGRLGGI